MIYSARYLCDDTLDNTLNLIFSSKLLTNSLADWWRHKGKLPSEEAGLGFIDWICKKIDDADDCLSAHVGEAPPGELVEVLRVNAVGDPIALETIDDSKEEGFKSDVDCYVEDGVVYSSVWLAGLSADEAYDRAKTIAKTFRSHGYATDIYVDEEDDTEVTVNASVDFDFFYKEILPKVRSL